MSFSVALLLLRDECDLTTLKTPYWQIFSYFSIFSSFMQEIKVELSHWVPTFNLFCVLISFSGMFRT